MELSLQSKVNYESIYEKREKMILEEKLHIQDSIDYEKFKFLFEKYGQGLEEKSFARYFLDISAKSYYNLQAGLRNSSTILEQEYYKPEELDEIREKIIESERLEEKTQINYEELLELHKEFGGKFSLKMFAEETLELNAHRVDDLNFNRNSKAYIWSKPEEYKESLRKMRIDIAENSGLHIGSQIDLEKFNELYDKYVKNAGLEIERRIFALKVLGISIDTFLRFERGKRPVVKVFPNYPINPRNISKLREKVILEEGFHLNELFPARDFDMLYEKYAGILTEEIFAEEILDVSIDSVNISKRRNQNINILGRIELQEEYITDLRKKIIKEKRLKYNELKSLKQIQKLYKEYGNIMSEKQFVTKVLLIPDYNYYQLCAGTTEQSYILPDAEKIDFRKIRRRVIEENNLHYDDVINYKTFHKLHQYYAPSVREYIFAYDILDINQSQLDALRNDKKNHRVHILLGEPLPTEKELKELKQIVISENKLHRRDKINFMQFMKLYKKYSGIMPLDMFGLKILDIQPKSITKIKTGKQKSEIQILLNTYLSEELAQIMESISSEKLYPGCEITLNKFNELYQKYGNILSRREFLIRILKVRGEKLRSLEQKEVSKIRIGTLGEREELSDKEKEDINKCLTDRVLPKEIAIKFFIGIPKISKYIISLKQENEEIYNGYIYKMLESHMTKKRILKLLPEIPEEDIDAIALEVKQNIKPKMSKVQLKSRAEGILERYQYDSTGIAKVEEYIGRTKEDFEKEKLDKSELDFIEECIEFAQSGREYIEFFTKACISFGQYKKAHKFLVRSIYHEVLSKEDREILGKMNSEVKLAIKKRLAVQMISSGETDIKILQDKTNLSASEVIHIRNKMLGLKRESLENRNNSKKASKEHTDISIFAEDNNDSIIEEFIFPEDNDDGGR